MKYRRAILKETGIWAVLVLSGMRGLLWTGLHEIEAYAVCRIGLRQGNYLFILENGAPQKPHGAVNIAIKRCDDEALVSVRVLQNIVANFFSVLTNENREPRAL